MLTKRLSPVKKRIQWLRHRVQKDGLRAPRWNRGLDAKSGLGNATLTSARAQCIHIFTPPELCRAVYEDGTQFPLERTLSLIEAGVDARWRGWSKPLPHLA